MTTLQVEIGDFVDAADLLYDDIAQPVRAALGRLTTTLAGCGSMAGDDEGGRGWAKTYDEAAASVVAATRVFALASLRTASLFGRSAGNYADAERAATTGPSHAPALPPWSLGSASLPPVVTPPSAAGGGSDEPTAWGLIKHLVGYVWPNGHQDKLRRAAAAYRFCAETLETAAGKPMLASIPFHLHRLPEADDIITVCRGLSNRANELATAHHQLADSCEELAHHIDRCHSEVEAELTELAIESVAIQGVGAVISIFTFGAAEVPTQAVQGARLAAVAARVTELIRRFVTAARALDAAVVRVSEAAQRIKLSLDGLASARLVYAGVTQVPNAARIASMTAKGREAAAAGRVADTAGKAAAAARTARAAVATRVSETSKTISAQRQARHLRGSSQYRGGGYFHDVSDAQRVLDAVHSGEAELIRITNGGHLLVRWPKVVGYNTNRAKGYRDQVTDMFLIKGTRSVSVVPSSPAG